MDAWFYKIALKTEADDVFASLPGEPAMLFSVGETYEMAGAVRGRGFDCCHTAIDCYVLHRQACTFENSVLLLVRLDEDDEDLSLSDMYVTASRMTVDSVVPDVERSALCTGVFVVNKQNRRAIAFVPHVDQESMDANNDYYWFEDGQPRDGTCFDFSLFE